MTVAADDVWCMPQRAVDMTRRLTEQRLTGRGSQARPPLPRLLPRWHVSMCYLVCWYVGMLARWYVGGVCFNALLYKAPLYSCASFALFASFACAGLLCWFACDFLLCCFRAYTPWLPCYRKTFDSTYVDAQILTLPLSLSPSLLSLFALSRIALPLSLSLSFALFRSLFPLSGVIFFEFTTSSLEK